MFQKLLIIGVRTRSLIQITSFQEHILPRRTVYFVDDKVYFRCRHSVYTECCYDYPLRDKNTASHSLSSMLPMAVHMEVPLEDFTIILLYYTRRAFTNQQDVLAAMVGIIRRFSEKLKYRFFEGLPIGALDAIILFKPCSLLQRRKGFPSYSWSGWKGPIVVNIPNIDEVNSWLRNQTWIIWYKRSPSGIVNLVWDPSANELFPSHDPKFLGYRERQAFQIPPELRITTSRTSPTDNLPFDMPRLTYPILQFWTLAVYYKIGNIDVFSGKANIFTGNAAVDGTLEMDGFEETTFFLDPEKVFEFILLSEDCTSSDQYNVMLLEWDSGIAERRGIGNIKKSAIRRSLPPGPVWKEILLA